MEPKANKKKFQIPDTYALLLFFIIFAAILTYIIPAGIYDKFPDTTTIDPNSFHFVDRTPVNLFDAIQSISLGMIKGAKIIFSIFLVSGAFKVINDTGAIEAGIDSLSNRLKDKIIFLIPVILTAMSILGYLEIIVNQTIVFIPIGLVIARKLKMDPIVGLSMMYLGTYVGFVFGGMGPFTVQVAQTIAGVPVLSGIGFRTAVFVIALIATAIFLMRYAQKVMANPASSALGTDKYDWAVDVHEDQKIDFDGKHKIILLAIFVAFGIYIYGALNYKWSMNELNTVTIFLAVFAGVLTKMSVNGMAKSFIDGCKMATYSALLIGFATAISVVLTNGNVISTIIYYCSLPLASTSRMVSGVLIFFFNWIFNFFVPSGSGQAAVVMPILAPLGDVIGLSKQVIISGYKYGDGITNLIIPTSGTLMGFIGLARISYQKWLKFILPLVGIWTLISTCAIIVGVAIGWQ
ncbi:YfcC family protein [Fusibacter paucivorans]|uniref:YfcC family protein n=1 Tax=Fusibacter paucivorans TaxID=76009 RepID=A0ABS5PM94_9FIRM|nr:TIGR00366 family protein [Fusibacter paucivorans]MBS7526166.1 YfcC family protein [Fusibacter paucivorans]